jgi:transposase-like protein
MERTADIPTRYRLRVKHRLAVVEYVRQHGIKPASRQFGLARPAVRQWWRNWQRAGIQGLMLFAGQDFDVACEALGA